MNYDKSSAANCGDGQSLEPTTLLSPTTDLQEGLDFCGRIWAPIYYKLDASLVTLTAKSIQAFSHNAYIHNHACNTYVKRTGVKVSCCCRKKSVKTGQ